jgi:hypothetical protein
MCCHASSPRTSPSLDYAAISFIGLLPGTTYYYKVGDPRYYYGMSPVISFKTMGAAPGMPSALPFRYTLILVIKDEVVLNKMFM